MKEKLTDFQKEVGESAQKIWLAGLGALAVAGEEGGKLFRTLVERGEAFQKQDHATVESVKRGVDSAKEKAEELWEKLEVGFNQRIANVLGKMGVPTKDEINQLTQRVDALMEAIKKMNAGKGEDKKAAKKTAKAK